MASSGEVLHGSRSWIEAARGVSEGSPLADLQEAMLPMSCSVDEHAMAVPVFIGGCGRSGTTLLAASLGAHSKCLCVPESHFRLSLFRGMDGTEEGLSAEKIGREIGRHWSYRAWGLGHCLNRLLAEQSSREPADVLGRLVFSYGQKQQNEVYQLWIDHTPTNVRYASRLNVLFPEARFIHIVRDGRAVAASVLPLDWGPNTVAAAAKWWSESLCYGLAAESYIPEVKMTRVRYEDLVSDPAGVLRGLCAFLELEYEPKMVTGAGFDVPEFTKAQHSLVGEPPDVSRVDAWKGTLTPSQVAIFERLTADLLVMLGYSPACSQAETLEAKGDNPVVELLEVLLGLRNRLRIARRRSRWLR